MLTLLKAHHEGPEMPNTFGQDLVAAMAEATAHARAKGAVARERVVEVPDVRTIYARRDERKNPRR